MFWTTQAPVKCGPKSAVEFTGTLQMGVAYLWVVLTGLAFSLQRGVGNYLLRGLDGAYLTIALGIMMNSFSWQ